MTRAMDLTIDELTKARAIVEAWCQDLERRADLPQNADKDTGLFRKTAWMARRELLGDGGCVLARLDSRYLEPAFREMIRAAHEVVDERESS